MYTMKIEGMMCPRCQASDPVGKEDLTKTVADAGYEAVSIE